MAKQAGLPLNPTEWGGKPKLTPPSKPSDTQVSSTAKQHMHFSGKNGGSIGKHLDLNWLAVQSGIWVPLAFVQAEHDGVSLDNFPPACFEYQMESFSWWAGTVPNFAGAFSPDFGCFCNYLDRIIWACSRLAQGKCWATQHESTLPLFVCQHNSVVNVKQQAIRTCLTVIHRFSKGQKGTSCHMNPQNDTDPSAKSFQALKKSFTPFSCWIFFCSVSQCAWQPNCWKLLTLLSIL